jgi:hypothetical protein
VPDERRPTPLFVEVDVHGENGVTLFQGGGQVHRATPAPRTFRGLVAFVGGDGDAVFTATQLGPVIVLERILVAATASERSPPARAVVLGAPLAASLRQLPRNAPKRSVEYPQIHEVALRLAEAADSFFAPGLTLRPPAAIGDLLIPLVGDWYLDLDVHAHGMVTLGLTKSGAPAPAVEWLVGTRTELRFVRPDAGTGKGPRYYLRGIVVPEASIDVLDLVGRQRDVERARKTLFAIGADPRATDASTRRR